MLEIRSVERALPHSHVHNERTVPIYRKGLGGDIDIYWFTKCNVVMCTVICLSFFLACSGSLPHFFVFVVRL